MRKLEVGDSVKTVGQDLINALNERVMRATNWPMGTSRDGDRRGVVDAVWDKFVRVVYLDTDEWGIFLPGELTHISNQFVESILEKQRQRQDNEV